MACSTDDSAPCGALSTRVGAEQMIAAGKGRTVAMMKEESREEEEEELIYAPAHVPLSAGHAFGSGAAPLAAARLPVVAAGRPLVASRWRIAALRVQVELLECGVLWC